MPSYFAILRRRGAPGFVTAGFVGRLPISMIGLGIVLLVTAAGGNYALAGAMSAAYALAAAFVGPLGARWVDRRGQRRVVPVLLAIQVTCLVAFTVAVATDLPVAGQFGLVIVAGAGAPNVGSLVRARWAHLLAGDPGLRSAFALEAVVDELVFVVGPPLVTVVALSVNEYAGLALVCILLVVGVLALVAQPATQPPPRPAEPGESHPRLLSGRLLIVTSVLCLMGGVFGAFEVTTVAFTRALGHEELTGFVLALYAVGSLLAGLAFGVLRPVWSLPRQLVASTLVLAIVSAPLPFVGTLPLLMGAAFLSGVAVSPVLIVTVAMVEDLVHHARLTEALTLSTSGIAVGLAVAAPTSGALIDSFGDHTGYFVMAGCALAAAAVSAVAFPTLRRSGDGAEPG